jgi:pimeloyl-ACP methyl ester carboxylesterase
MILVGGMRLRVARGGEGSPLLLINGLGAGLEMWEPFVARLSRREVSPSTFPEPGSRRPGADRLRMPTLASRVVAALQRELGYDRMDVLGYSLGGLVAQELAYRTPAQVRRLVLVATTPGMPSIPPHPLVTLMMLSPARYYDRRIAQFVVPRIAGGRTAREPGALQTGLDLRLVRPPSTRGYLHQLYAAAGWSSRRWLRRLRQPTLVIHGDEDPVVPVANARYLARAIPNARLQVVPRAGHLLLLDEPERAVMAIEDFLEADPFP